MSNKYERGNTSAGRPYLEEHGPEARRRKADEREEAREGRTPQERLAILDRRLGVGVGAQRERARLQAQINAR